MARAYNASQRWEQLDGSRRGFITRCEKFSRLTIPKVCPQEGYQQNTTELQHDWQSIGALAVNNLTNRMMLALFAPSRPFFRYDVPKSMVDQLVQASGGQLTAADIDVKLAQAEKDAVKDLNKTGARPSLYEIIRHLIVVGNCLMLREGDSIRALGLKKYVVKRSARGKVLEVVIREKVKVDELDEDLQKLVQGGDADTDVFWYRWFCWDNNKYRETQWVNDQQAHDQKYMGSYTEQTLPVTPLTWDLSDDADYGTGLVEDYSGDFETVSMMSEAEVNAAIAASQFRWFMAPNGFTNADDLRNSQNGDVLPGDPNDVKLMSGAELGPNVKIISESMEAKIRRISAGFLVTTGVIRNAERVTQEEIRQTVQELETALGGTYSRIAVDFQLPIAYWLAKRNGIKLAGKAITPIIITGLDALSRNGDLDDVRQFIADVVQIAQLKDSPAGAYLKYGTIFKALAAGRGLNPDDYVKGDDQVQAEAQQAQQQELTSNGIQEQQAAQAQQAAKGQA